MEQDDVYLDEDSVYNEDTSDSTELTVFIHKWARTLRILFEGTTKVLRMTPELLVWLCEPSPPGRWYRVIKTENGVATVEMRDE